MSLCSVLCNFVFVTLLSSRIVSVEGSVMESKMIDAFKQHDLHSYFDEKFVDNPAPTLHQLMYTGQSIDQWITGATQVATLLAKLRIKGAKEALHGVIGSNLSSPCALHDWLKEKSEDVNFIPDRLKRAYGGDRIKHRALEAIKLLEKEESVCLQNVVTKNVKISQSRVLVNANSVKARYGPAALDTAIFIADLLIMYYKQMGVLDHGVQWKTVETLHDFGRAFDEESKQHGVTEENKRRWWANVSLLTGWAFLQRIISKDNVEEILARREQDLTSVTECGLRLINNEHIDSPGFLVNVALALLA